MNKKLSLLSLCLWLVLLAQTIGLAQNITLPPVSASIQFTNPITSSSMSMVVETNSGAEAYTEAATVGGVACRKIPSGKFMYVSCNRSTIPTSQNNLLIAVTYYANSNNTLWFNYNGASNDYTGADFQKTLSNQWVTTIVTITDATLKGSMNGGGDFRMGFNGEDNYIKEIKVYKGALDPVSQAIPASPNSSISDFKNKSFAGYQIWHKAGNNAADWVHWSYGVVPAAGFGTNENIASFPDLSEVQSSEAYPTNFAALGNGKPTKLYNDADASIINRQMGWLQTAGLDGVAIQRFVGPIGRNVTVSTASPLTNVKNACESTGRLFYICYDLNGADATIVQRMQMDWVYEIEQMRALTSSPNYATVNGKPVVEIWGIGYDMVTSNQTALDLIHFLQSRGCYVIGGTPRGWRTNSEGANPNFTDVYNALNCISPWTVGVYNDIAGANNYLTSKMVDDKSYCTSHGIDYLPVAFAGSANWLSADGSFSQTDRQGGKLLWQQVVNAKSIGLTAVYYAMLDEFEESTNLIKGAVDYFDIPTDQYFETFAKDGVWVGSDYYLRLAATAAKLLRGQVANTPTIPIEYSNGPMYFRNSFESRTTVYNMNGATATKTLKIDPCFFNPAALSNAGITSPSVAIVNESSFTKSGIYSAKATGTPASGSSANYYYKMSDVKITVKQNMQISFWKYSANALGQYTNIDLVFQSGKRLKDLPAYADNNGAAMSPTVARGAVGSWQQFTCQIGTGELVGDVITGIVLGYDHPSASGSYTAYFDDIIIQDGTSSTVAVTGVSLSPATASLTVGGTQQLTATIAPSNATNKNVTWSSGNAAVATVSTSGLVTAVAAGSTTITATTQDGSKTSTSSITVTNSTTGIPQNFGANPIFRDIFTADPSAHVWADGRLYVYPSHDISPPRGCDLMDKYHVYSTNDMVNWIDHGQILSASQVPWGRPSGGFMWAPDCAYKNGTYYYYFPHPSDDTDWNDTWKIGIATSTSPASGFTVQGYINGLESFIDPCVFVDDDGQVYFYYGGGGTCKGGKMKDNMIEIDGTLQPMQGLVDFHEATWVHKHNGVYYLSYSDNNSVGGNQMRYATSSSPLGPWNYKGIYIDPTGSATNHGSIVEYKGQSYAFYHNSALSGNDWLRSVCVDKLNYNADGTIQKVIQTKAHGTPYGGTARAIPGTIQMEDFDDGGQGVSYLDSDTLNTGGQYRLNDRVDIENCSEGGYDVGFTSSGEYMEYTVNVAAAGTYTVNLRAASGNTGGTVQLKTTDGTVLGTFTVAGTTGWQTWATFTTTVTLPAGIQILQVTLPTGGYNLNYMQFVKVASSPVITSAATATGTTGTAFSYQISASDSPTGFGATGLPAGVSVNTSTGLISGTPTTAGTYTATVTATNANGTGNKTVTITISNPAASTPYGGTPWPIPGKIEVENYDNGGEGIAYHDNDATNSGQFRTSEGVDAENCGDTGGTYDIGFTNAGEWMKYTVNVTTTGAYTLEARVASTGTGNSIHVELDGVNISGSIAIPNTTGWQTYQSVTVTTPSITAGQHVLRIYEETGGFNINYINFTTVASAPVISSAATASGVVGTAFNYAIIASNTPTSFGATGLPAGLSVNTTTGLISGTPTTAGTYTATVTATNSGGTGNKAVTITITTPVTNTPYGGTAWPIPGKIEVENYDNGGEGIAYHDNDATNSGQFRTSEGVDAENCGDTGGTYDIGFTNAGEWMKYTVNVTTAGTYTIQARVAAPNTGSSIHVELDGINISGSIAIPNTTGWQTYQTITATTPALTAGQHVVRLYEETGGFNINYLNFVANGTVTKPVITSSTTASATLGNSFTYNITASNAPTTYSATGLPSGLSVNTSTGVISGALLNIGTYNVTIAAANSAGSGSATLAITVSPVTDAANAITAYKAPGTITVNGNLNETGWSFNKTISKTVTGTVNNNATFGVMWDNANLYIGVKVLDANLYSDSPDMWNDDAVEIYIDANYNKLASYDGFDNQIIKGYNKSGVFTKFALSGLQHASAAISGGYAVEIAMPWAQLGISTPTGGMSIGFDISNDDDDNGGDRDGQAVWNGTIDNYQYTNNFGTLTLNNASALRLGQTDALAGASDVALYPVPVANGILNASLPIEWTGTIQATIHNSNGVLVQNNTVAIDDHLATFNVSSLSAGIYFLQLVNEDNVIVTKTFMIQ